MKQVTQERPKTKPPTKSRIPIFKTIGEEAEFWDTHDTTEFEDEFEEVTDVKFVKYRPPKAITVRVDETTLTALTEQAAKLDIGASTLVRTWILERLQEGTKPARAAS